MFVVPLILRFYLLFFIFWHSCFCGVADLKPLHLPKVSNNNGVCVALMGSSYTLATSSFLSVSFNYFGGCFFVFEIFDFPRV